VTESVGGVERRTVTAPGVIDGWGRARFRSRLRRITHGEIALVEGQEAERFGASEAELRAKIFVLDPRFYRSVALRGVLGGAEAYMEGWWRSDSLTSLIRIMARNRAALAGLDSGPARWLRPSLNFLHALRRNSRAGSRRNIAAHYDLGNEFFELFLDPTLTYSCGIFERDGMSMEEASRAKYERICRKLRLGPADHVLEIGGGWGGFAIHAARNHGCRVTATTISREQCELARQRVADAGLADRVEVRFEDYRDSRGSYDKLVSIEMIEAVGHRNLDSFFRVCGERLRPDGAMLLQAITVPDRGFESSKRNVDFIKRYIFPGGQLVAVGPICNTIARVSDLRVTHLEDITPHYAETLSRWRGRMFENLDRMRGLGLPERFLSMWEFYLCYCEGSFRERANGALQMLLEKPMCRQAPILGRLG
jgi:cyclopropane-fatty-acyl-phospholipid synthase